jgi:hypothetical protein
MLAAAFADRRFTSFAGRQPQGQGSRRRFRRLLGFAGFALAAFAYRRRLTAIAAARGQAKSRRRDAQSAPVLQFQRNHARLHKRAAAPCLKCEPLATRCGA